MKIQLTCTCITDNTIINTCPKNYIHVLYLIYQHQYYPTCDYVLFSKEKIRHNVVTGLILEICAN